MNQTKVAFVTGASGGIGSAIAIKLNQLGYNLALNYNQNIEPLIKLKDLLTNKTAKTIIIQGDVADFESSQSMIQEAIASFGRMDVLVNNAGITNDKLLLKMTGEDFSEVIRINLNGTFNCTKHVSKIMMKQKSGCIINISSVIGLMGNIGQSNYAASKAGIIGFTKSIAKELARKNITCNAIAPGFIQTKMTSDMSEEVIEAIKKNIPLKRLGDPEDIANLVAFLCSDQAAYITGQTISVDGGLYI